MKKFISKHLGAIIAATMVAGLAILGFGLDWDQSQILWKANISGWLIGAGSVMFVGSVISLIANTGSGG